jgi:hypothetical protein
MSRKNIVTIQFWEKMQSPLNSEVKLWYTSIMDDRSTGKSSRGTTARFMSDFDLLMKTTTKETIFKKETEIPTI